MISFIIGVCIGFVFGALCCYYEFAEQIKKRWKELESEPCPLCDGQFCDCIDAFKAGVSDLDAGRYVTADDLERELESEASNE